MAVEDGALCSMAAMLSATLCTPEGERVPVGYVYALATNPDKQGRGNARQLLGYADDFLRARGDRAMVLVPASASLHRFFEATGMTECFSHRKSEFLSANLTGEDVDGVSTPIGPEEYNAIREAYLADSLHIAYSDDLIRFQETGSRMTGGGLYRVEVADDAEVGCAAVEYLDAHTLVMKELLTYHQYTRQAVELAAKVLPARRYFLRTPAVWERFQGNYTQPFGMVKWYDQSLQDRYLDRLDGYLGLAFD